MDAKELWITQQVHLKNMFVNDLLWKLDEKSAKKETEHFRSIGQTEGKWNTDKQQKMMQGLINWLKSGRLVKP